MTPMLPSFAIQLEALPTAVRDLVEAIGETDALRLIGLVGGSRISVPKVPAADHPLRAGLSVEGFDRFVRRYGGGHVELPKGDAYLRRLRHDVVRQCRESGMTMDAIAEATGYTRRHVINILGGHADAGEDVFTLDLFAEAPRAVSKAASQHTAAPAEAAGDRYAGKANNPFGL